MDNAGQQLEAVPPEVVRPLPQTPQGVSRSRRVSVRETIYIQEVGRQPRSVSHVFWKTVGPGEEPWRRQFTAGAAWEPLDLGWVGETTSTLHLLHQGAAAAPPVGGQREEPVVELGVWAGEDPGEPRDMHSPPVPGVVVPFAGLVGGESLRLCPLGAGRLRVRAAGGTARLALTLFPG